ncbi:uncharacterized protein LOC141899588 [Tubulanus polymorphus]|uniref:uncharacterized protein LOC141899588 n=1 Tax=Tubulanus polymorphus TaxID=672921 RepID=UPI003DA5D4FC
MLIAAQLKTKMNSIVVWVIVASSILTMAMSQNSMPVNVTITSNRTHNNLPAAYQYEQAELTAEFQPHSNTVYEISLTLVFPFEKIFASEFCYNVTVNRSLNFGEFYDAATNAIALVSRNTSTGFVCNTTYRVTKPSVYPSTWSVAQRNALGVETGVASVVQTFAYVDSFSRLYVWKLDVRFGRVQFNESKTIIFRAPLAISSSAAKGQPLDVQASLRYQIYNASGLIQNSTETSSASLVVIGPQLQVVFSPSSLNDVEAGNSYNFQVMVQHSSTYSSEAASNVQVYALALPTGLELVNQVTFINISTATSLYNFAELQAGLSIGLMNIGDSIRFTGVLRAVDTFRVNINSYLTLYANYEYPTQPVSTASLMAISSCIFSGKKIAILSTSIDLPPQLKIGQTITGSATFSMPLGTLSNLQFRAEIYSPAMNPVPFKIYTATASASNPQVQFTKTSLTSTDFIATAKRRKRHVRNRRALAPSLVISAPFGSVTNPSSGVSGTPIVLQAQMTAVAAGALPGGYLELTPYLDLNVLTPLHTISSVIQMPVLNIQKTVQNTTKTNTNSIPKVEFQVQISHAPSSNSDAYDLKLTDKTMKLESYPGDGMVPSPKPNSLKIGGASSPDFIWNYGQLPVGSNLTLRYLAAPSSEATSILPNGTTVFPASVDYYGSTLAGVIAPATDVRFTLGANTCLFRKSIEQSNVIKDYGLTVLAAFLGLLVAVILVCVIFAILNYCAGKNKRVSPDVDFTPIKSNMKTLILDAKDALKKTGNTIKDFSCIAADESLVFILALKDKLQIHRELDSLDILSTINTDIDIGNERNDASIQATLALINSLATNKDIGGDTQNKALSLFRGTLQNMDGKVGEDYRKELARIIQELAKNNKSKLAELLGIQAAHKEKVHAQIAYLSPEDQKEVMDLIDKQHTTEQNELAYRLKLEQDEQTEKTRKEFAIRRRMAIKETQQTTLDGVVTDGDLTQEQADWLMREHAKLQSKLEKLYDDEISRQRMVLEEKLTRRKGLAATTEAQEDYHSELLNTVAGHQLDVVNRAKKTGKMTKVEARELTEKLTAELKEAKDKMEKERERQQLELHNKLSAKKKQRLQEQAQLHSKELSEYMDKETQSVEDGPVDPVALFTRRQNMLSHQRMERSELENKIDQEHADELLKLRENLTHQIDADLDAKKKALLEQMKEQGAYTDDQIRRILREHEQETKNLEEMQTNEMMRQENKFKEKLAKNRESWIKRMEEEKQEQEQLRNHEDNVVRNIMDKQVSMSDAEREQILKEHEKHMVTLENSLTLNKLRQKHMLEQRLAQKRAAQIEKLDKKQNTENKKLKQMIEDDEELDEAEIHQQKVDMLKKHAEQKISVLQGEKLKIEDELEQIRAEMMQDRVLALKDQEERLAAMLANLQLEKAKELAKIEEQQKAINNLKSSLMDDLTDRGVLSNPECQRVIEIHQQEKEKLNKKLEVQRQKQEKFLKSKLQEKMSKREANLVYQQDQEIMQATSMGTNKTAARLRKAALMSKHVLEMEQLRNRIEREIEQNLQELRRQFEMKKMSLMQERELQFIAGLVRLGHFQKDELLDVLHLLFPMKSEEEIANLFAQIYTKEKEPETQEEYEQQQKALSMSSLSTLALRIKAATYGLSDDSSPLLKRRKKKKKSKRFGKLLGKEKTMDVDDELPPLTGFRPRPEGQSSNDVVDDQQIQARNKKLPPINT